MELILVLVVVYLLTALPVLLKPKPPKLNYPDVIATPKQLDPYTTIYMSKSSRDRYLASDSWALKRATRLSIDNYTCQSCGSTETLNIHHITYSRFGYEDINTDLITLCEPCHSKLHSELGYSRDGYYPIN